MPPSNYTVATAAQLLGSYPSSLKNVDEYELGEAHTANAIAQLRQKKLRFTPSTKLFDASVDKFVRDTGRVQQEVSGEAYMMTPALTASELFPEEEQPQRRVEFGPDLLASALFENEEPTQSQRRSGLNVNTSPQILQINEGKGHEASSDIFFSPLDVGGRGSNILFSSPLPTPTPPLTPTQESYDAEQAALKTKTQSPLVPTVAKSIEGKEQIRQKLTLGPEQLDYLVKALARSPLIQNLVRKQWWDGKAEKEVVEQASLLSLEDAWKDIDRSEIDGDESDDLSGSDASTSGTSIYSLPNEQFLAGERRPANPKALFSSHQTPRLPNHPNDSKRPEAKFGGVAIVDPSVDGSPVSCLSKEGNVGPNVKQVGECTFLKIPYASSADCHLRIEQPTTSAGNGLRPCSRVILQIINQMVERKTGEKAHLLVAEIDVTESFTKAALVELSTQSDVSLHNIEVVTLVDKARRESQEDVDWLELADELQALAGVNEIVDATAECFRVLTADDCTMQTLTLMSELNRLKARHQDFLIIRCHGESDDGIHKKIEAPWLSQHLDLYPDISSPETAIKVRHQLMELIAQKSVHEDAFSGKIEFEGKKRRLHCVPLVGGVVRRNVAWACFLRDAWAI